MCGAIPGSVVSQGDPPRGRSVGQVGMSGSPVGFRRWRIPQKVINRRILRCFAQDVMVQIFFVCRGLALLVVIIQGALSQRIPFAIDCLFLPRGNMRLSNLVTKSVIVSCLFLCLLILLFGLSGLGASLIL